MSGNDRWVVLDLFSGVGGFSAAFEDVPEWEVVKVNRNEEFAPDLCADILEVHPGGLLETIGGHDVLVVLAGHPCTLFSTAGNHDEWDLEIRQPVGQRARRHVAMLFHTLGLIHSLAPDYWYLENPKRSRARWFIGPPDEWVTYCQYGTEYQKPTGLWGDHAPGMTYRRCKRGDPCHASNTETDGTCAIASMDRTDHAERSRMPYDLSDAIRRSIEEAIQNPPPEQTTLITDGGDSL